MNKYRIIGVNRHENTPLVYESDLDIEQAEYHVLELRKNYGTDFQFTVEKQNDQVDA